MRCLIFKKYVHSLFCYGNAFIYFKTTFIYLHSHWLLMGVFSSPNCIYPFLHLFSRKSKQKCQVNLLTQQFLICGNYMLAQTTLLKIKLKFELFVNNTFEPSLPPHKHLASKTSVVSFVVSFLLTWLSSAFELLFLRVSSQAA